MKYTEYKNPIDFMNVCRTIFEEQEALYGLMLGISIRLVKNPLHYGSQPLLATISDNAELDLIALMTPPYKLQIALLNSDSFKSIQLLASKLRENGWQIPAVMGEEKAIKAFATHWNKVAGTNSQDGMRQRLYELRTVQQIQYPEGTFRQANSDDLELAIKWSNSFYDDCFGDSEDIPKDGCFAKLLVEEGNLYFWGNPDPVSMAALTRPTPHGIAIGYVYTPPQYRRKGYASAITAQLSQYALDNGKKFCTLYTDSSNPTTNSIYQKIGYNPVADIMDVHFTS
jgi:predicted GNAT family acetyltransferase